jgi:molybdopterin molybdotransferase
MRSISLITYQEALATILKNVPVLEVEEKPLFKCLYQVLAEDIYSDYDLPLKDQSGPDGYAVIARDITGASRETPVVLKISGSIRAGILPVKSVKPGTAMRIMTGALVPDGADCVVRFEDTDEPGDKSGPNKDNTAAVKIYVAAAAGTNINPKGASIKQGSLVMSRGTKLGPAQISVLTTIGKAVVKVIRRPVIGILSSGDELIALGKTLTPGKSFNSNSAAIAALVTHFGGIPRTLGIARDNQKSVLTRVQKGLQWDAVICSGGVAKGDFDLTRSIMAKVGETLFYKINMGPGASVAFGLAKKSIDNNQTRSIPIFALAEPPAGCLINMETLVRPAIQKMRGQAKTEHSTVKALARDGVPGKRPMNFVRWTSLEREDGEYRVEINRADRIGPLLAIADANAMLIVPVDTTITRGDEVQVLPLDWRQEYI